MQYVLLGVGGAAGTAWSWKWLTLIPWPVTTALAAILLAIAGTFVAYAAKWMTASQVAKFGMVKPVSWLARAPVVDASAAVAPPPALRAVEHHDAAALTAKMAAAVECQDQLLSRIGIDLAHRLRLAPAGPTKPAFSAIVTGTVGKSLLAGEIAKAIGWELETLSGRTSSLGIGTGLRDRVENGDTSTVLDQLVRSKKVVVIDHAGDLDQQGQRVLAELAAGDLVVGGRRVAGNQVILLILAADLDRLDRALVGSVDAVYQLAELDAGGLAKVGVRQFVEAGTRNGVSFRPSPDAVAAVGAMPPRDAARLLDGLAAEATAAGVSGEAVVDLDGAGRVVLIRPF